MGHREGEEGRCGRPREECLGQQEGGKQARGLQATGIVSLPYPAEPLEALALMVSRTHWCE